MENNTTEGYLKHISDSLKNGKAAVLIGAGFSKNAEKSIQSAPDFPLWNDLGNAFYNKLYPNDSEKKYNYTNPQDLAEQIEASYGRPVLDNLLINLIPDLQYKPSSLYKKLLELPWTDIFTTNYDTLLERASCDVIENRFRIISCKEDLTSGAEVPRIIKLHGTFPSYRPFIITTEDYRTYPHQFAPFVNTVQQSLLENTFCLIGFSGNDPNFLSWIGWIHDNLGIENSPYMYLLVHHPMPEVQRKLLYKKRIITVDISYINANKITSDKNKYESLLDYFLNDASMIKINWIVDKKINFTGSSFDQIISQLECLHKQYPGWIVSPSKERSMISMYVEILQKTLMNLTKKKEKKELLFLYEYNWLREQCLRPLCDDDMEAYKVILRRHSQCTHEEEHLIISLLLSLLQQTRENGNDKEWIVLSQNICDQQPVMDDDEKDAFIYEQCLFALFHFEYERLNKALDEWKNNISLPLRMIQKAGLLGECGRLEEAYNLTRNNLISIRHQLQRNDDDYFLLSCENICISISGFIRAAMKFHHKKEVNNQVQKMESYENDVNKKRNYIHHKYQCAWEEENEKLQQSMESPYIPYRIQTIKPSFDLGYITTNVCLCEDKDFINAYAFLHFREKTGYPLRLYNITHGTNAAKGAAQRIAKVFIRWAIITLVRANEENEFENLFNRTVLNKTTVEQIDDMCSTYLDILDKIEPWILSNGMATHNFAEQAARVLPALLSFFCCKCSDKILVRILKFLLRIYKSEHRLIHGNIKKFAIRLIKALSTQQIVDNFDTILEFPVFKNYNPWYPDPIEYINLTLTTLKIEKNKFESMFKLAQKGNLGAERRVIFLALEGLLSDRQKKAVGKLIWQNDKLNSLLFFRNIFLDLSWGESANCKNKLKTELLADLTEASENTSISSKLNDLLIEVQNCILRKIFNTKDIFMIISDCNKLTAQCILKLQSNKNIPDVFRENKDLTNSLYQLSVVLTYIFIYYPRRIVSNEETAKINRIVNIIDQQHICHPLLLILWNKKIHQNINEQEMLIYFLLYGSEYQKKGVYNTLFIFIKNYKLNKTINRSTFVCLLYIIIDQVIWDGGKYRTWAIDVFTCTIKNLNNIISKEIFDKLLQGLQLLIKESEITEEDTEKNVNQKTLLRVAAACLANEIIKFYDSQNKEIPEVLKQWENICNDYNEFVEVRRTMNN